MSGSYRGVIFSAIGIAVLIAFGLGAFITALSYPQQARYQSYGYSEPDQRQTIANTTPHRTPCINPKSESEADLCAQWRAAIAAERSAEWTKYGVLASIVGISFLLWQIMLTRRAVADTGKATEAMNEANKIAAAAQRAWISIKPLVEIVPINSDMVLLKAEAEFTNIGASVATNVSKMTRFVAAPFADALKIHNELFQKMRKEGGHRTFMPGMVWSGGLVTNGFSASQIKWDQDERAHFSLITIAVYNIEGDNRRHYSRAIWRLRKKDDALSDGRGLTWEQLATGDVEVEPNPYVVNYT